MTQPATPLAADPRGPVDAAGNMHPGFFTKPDTCPDCGRPSTATKLITKPEDKEKPWTRQRCDACGDKRVQAERAEREREARAARAREALASLGVPPLYADATIDTFEVRSESAEDAAKKARVVQLARRYIAEWPDVPMIAVFVGCPGSGKGHIAWSLARAVALEGGNARVCVLSDVIRDLREAWGSRDEGTMSEAQRLAKYRAADLLVIDEVSRHAFYGQPQQHLYDLVAWRELRLRPTILTTNETGESLAEFLGVALSSRALGWGPPWDFGDSDFRLSRGMRRQR